MPRRAIRSTSATSPSASRPRPHRNPWGTPAPPAAAGTVHPARDREQLRRHRATSASAWTSRREGCPSSCGSRNHGAGSTTRRRTSSSRSPSNWLPGQSFADATAFIGLNDGVPQYAGRTFVIYALSGPPASDPLATQIASFTAGGPIRTGALRRDDGTGGSRYRSAARGHRNGCRSPTSSPGGRHRRGHGSRARRGAGPLADPELRLLLFHDARRSAARDGGEAWARDGRRRRTS